MKHTLARIVKTGSMLTCVAGAFGASLRADTPAAAPTTAPAATASTDSVTTLEKYTVSDVPTDEQVLPTVRPIGSVYGDDRSILDTPRSVSSVNKAWMDDRLIKNAMDFGQFSPGVYAAAQYGIPGVPQIRGDLGQIYVDGQLIPFSRNSTPLSFNNVEAMDIVKGPGTAVYGPQGNGPGGYVNFVSKQPYFDKDHYDISTTFGYWTSGHSYSNPEYTIDFGGPISDKLAYRVSYLGRYGDAYYLNAKDQTQDVYTALTYLFSSTTKFEWWAQGFATRTNEITGTNRVTEDFIKNGNYIAGAAIPSISVYGFPFGVDILASPTAPYGTLADGSYSIVNPATAHTVKLSPDNALVGPSDTARSKLFHSQLKATTQISPDASLVNSTYFGLEHSNKFETYGYDEYVPRSESIQDRLELHDKLTLAGMEHSLITGLDYRFTYIRAYDDYQTEPFTYYDLTQPASQIFYPGYYYEGKTWGSGLQVPGEPGYSSVEHQDSTINDYAAFVQDDIKLGARWSTILGFREDRIAAESANPPLTEVGYYNADFEYVPLATPIYFGKGATYDVKATATDPSYFASFIFKMSDTQSMYLTYDRVDAIHGASNFGGVDSGGNGTATGVGIMPAGSSTDIQKSISVGSTLYEIGYKGSYLGNTLYFGSALFQQIKTESQLEGPNFLVKASGIEVDAVYQPTKRLTINANASWQDATAYGSYYFQETGSYLDDFATTTVVDGQHGTGVGAVNYTGYEPPNGRMRAPGVPQFLANLFIEYKLPMGLAAGVGPNIIGKQYANDQDTLYIPPEVQVDGYVTYAPTKRWDVRVNVTNLLDSRLLDPIDVSFAGNDTIFVRKPISASLTVRFHL